VKQDMEFIHMDSEVAKSPGYPFEGCLYFWKLDEADDMLSPIPSLRLPFSTLDKTGLKGGDDGSSW